jgi:hypothetical protein
MTAPQAWRGQGRPPLPSAGFLPLLPGEVAELTPRRPLVARAWRVALSGAVWFAVLLSGGWALMHL